MGQRYDTISFLSDYGLEDEFVGVVKSVLRGVAPHTAVIDVTHGVAPHDVRAGSLALVRAVQYLAPGVVLAVVDPGVGTDRRAIAVEVGDGEAVFVGPDNGLLASAVSMVGGATRAVSLTNEEYHHEAPGPTFDGRDVFAPVAGHLCNGVDLSEFGEPIDPVTLRPGVLPLPREEDGRLLAEILWVDRFGNAQLNVGPDEVATYGEFLDLRWKDQVRTGRRCGTYADLRPGEIGVLVDSYGLLAISLDQAPAAERLGLQAGDAVAIGEAG